MNEFILTYRKLVMPDDLNHAKTLFGGRLLQWADEAAVLYGMCQIGSKSIVTLKMSEVLFKNPARNGDILEFWTRKSKIGKSSLGVECVVVRKTVRAPQDEPLPPKFNKAGEFNNPKDIILSCEFSFVHVDESGKPSPHQLAKA
jgi:acyl-CoA hydrolase